VEKSEFDAIIAQLEEVDVIACDTENSGTIRSADLWAGQHYLTGISIAWRWNGHLESAYFPFRHESDNCPKEWQAPLGDILKRKRLIFHNAKFDIAALSTIGIIITIPPYDTACMAHMCNEEFPSKALEWLSAFILKEKHDDEDKVEMWAKIYGWDTVPVELMERRAKKDAEKTYRLWEVFMKELAA
jgi:DNA polymerase I-like protein with 3'-5' exonuclease and polymerase domains